MAPAEQKRWPSLGKSNQATAGVGAVPDWKKHEESLTQVFLAAQCLFQSDTMLTSSMASLLLPHLSLILAVAAVLHDWWLVAIFTPVCLLHRPQVTCLELLPCPFPGLAAIQASHRKCWGLKQFSLVRFSFPHSPTKWHKWFTHTMGRERRTAEIVLYSNMVWYY